MTITIPIKVQTEGNANEHWRLRHARAVTQRLVTRAVLGGRKLPPLPVRVTFTRIGKRLMDTDNLVGSFKHVRDEVAALYGVGDGPNDPIEWAEPKQVIGKDYAVIAALDAAGKEQR